MFRHASVKQPLLFKQIKGLIYKKQKSGVASTMTKISHHMRSLWLNYHRRKITKLTFRASYIKPFIRAIRANVSFSLTLSSLASNNFAFKLVISFLQSSNSLCSLSLCLTSFLYLSEFSSLSTSTRPFSRNRSSSSFTFFFSKPKCKSLLSICCLDHLTLLCRL